MVRFKLTQEDVDYRQSYVYLDQYSGKILRVDSSLKVFLGDRNSRVRLLCSHNIAEFKARNFIIEEFHRTDKNASCSRLPICNHLK